MPSIGYWLYLANSLLRKLLEPMTTVNLELRINIYQMYVQNGCRFGFYVKRDSWSEGRYAKVVAIEWVEDGKMIKGNAPYFGGFKNPPGHPRAGKIMGPRLVTLEADWIKGGRMITDSGGNYSWIQVIPNRGIEF